MFVLREELRLSALLARTERFAVKFEAMQREARCALMKLTLACHDTRADSSTRGK